MTEHTYVPFHVHSDYSLLDSCTQFTDYVDLAVKNKMPAIAFSEHGKLSGWVKKKMYCDKMGIKYIHAVEIYITENLEPKVRDNFHTILIARNYAGIKEINEIVSRSFDKDHFYYNNRISIDEFLGLSKNVITTSACLASPLFQLDVSHPKYKQLVNRYDYLEIQPHVNSEDQKRFNVHLACLAEEYGKKLIAGTDTHSSSQYKAECRKILLERKHKSYGNEDEFDLSFKTYDELVELFKEQDALPEKLYMQAIENTVEMANEVEDFKLDCSLKYPILYGSREKDHEELVKTIDRKFAEKIESGAIPENQIQNFKDAIEEELRVFTKIQMDGFMLSMSEIISWCHDNGIVTGNARGSVAGSRIAYITDIIDLNPETWHTVFSRFANEDRVEVGDIDTDVIESDRPRIFEYVRSRFGEEKTARVSSFGTLKDKAVIDDVCGVFRERYKTEHPDVPDNKNPYSIAEVEKIKKSYQADPDGTRNSCKEIFYYFDGLLDTKISQSIHPAGMVISPVVLRDEYGTFDKDGDSCLFLDMDECHDIGLVKYDFLVLTNIEIIRNTCRMIGKPYPKSHEINWSDKDVWNDMLRCQYGVFQMESDFAFQLLCKYKPTSIEEMSLVTACIRPSGASYRNDLMNRIPHHNPSELIDELLKDQSGYLVYQEDIIAFLQQICGLSGSEADTVRRGIAKKNMDMLQEMMPRIVDGYCEKSDKPRSIAEQEATEFMKIIEDASAYMFGKNHSIAYCMIGYICAYLRYYYPKEYITCYLNCASSPDDVAKGTALADAYKIVITPPKYGVSSEDYRPYPDKYAISKGLASIKYMSAKTANDLLSISQSDDAPKAFSELLYRIKGTSIDRRQMDSLIKIDFFSQFGNQRELFSILQMFEFFKLGDAKSIKKSSVENEMLKCIIERHSNSKKKDGGEAASYKFENPDDVKCCIKEFESVIMFQGLQDIDMKVKIQNSIDILGYVGITTGNESDRKRLIVTDLTPVCSKGDGSIWAYRFSTKSIGSGKVSRLTVKSSLYNHFPFKNGDILDAKEVWKNNKGYWYLQSYEVE